MKWGREIGKFRVLRGEIGSEWGVNSVAKFRNRVSWCLHWVESDCEIGSLGLGARYWGLIGGEWDCGRRGGKPWNGMGLRVNAIAKA